MGNIPQKTTIKQIISDKKTNKKNETDPRAFVILDDCFYDDKWTRDVSMRQLFMNGKSWKFLLVITVQYPLGIPPALRTNVDYVFILRENIMRNQKKFATFLNIVSFVFSFSPS